MADAWSQALQDLRQATHALLPLALTDRQRADVSVISDAIRRLSSDGETEAALALAELATFDKARLYHLLTLTGPDLAQELLSRLTEDLTATLDGLEQGAVADNWKQLREATHVLISLAGSVGATSLQGMAETMNASAHQQNKDTTLALMPNLTRELRALITVVRSTGIPSSNYP